MRRLLLFCLIVLLSLQGCGQKKSKQFQIELPLSNFDYSITVRGEVFSMNEMSLSVPSGVGGSIQSIPESGTIVKKGDVLVVIESKNAEQQLKEKQRRLKYINRRINREKRRIAQDRLQQEIKVLEKTYALNLKKLETEFQLGEKDPRVIKSLDLKIQLLDQKIELQIDKLNSYEILSQTKSISDDQIERLRKNLRSTQVSRDLEKLDKRSKIEGTVGLKKEKLELEIKMLEQELEKVKKEQQEAEKSYPLRVEKLELEREKRKRQIKEALENQKKSKLATQSDGIFTRVTRWGGSEVKKGDDVWRGSTVGKVLDPNQLEIRLRLPERQINEIEVGHSVIIHSIQNNKKVSGKISRIDSLASLMNPRNKQSIKYHWATVDIDSKNLKSFRPGETVIANINLGHYQNSWIIPRELVNLESDGTLKINSLEETIIFPEYTATEDYFIVDATVHKDRIGEILNIIPDLQIIH